MKCTEFKIWIDHAKLAELRNPEEDIKDHLKHCNNCRHEHASMLDVYRIINFQKEQSLNSFQIESIAENLLKPKVFIKPYYRLTKVATIAIIIAGMITGMITGNLLSTFKEESTENTWSNEFTLLSDNTDYESYLFD